MGITVDSWITPLTPGETMLSIVASAPLMRIKSLTLNGAVFDTRKTGPKRYEPAVAPLFTHASPDACSAAPTARAEIGVQLRGVQLRGVADSTGMLLSQRFQLL